MVLILGSIVIATQELNQMNVISKKQILEFGKRNADAIGALNTWFLEAQQSSWKTLQDIKDNYRTASFLKGNMVIFNIKGNRYRLVTKISYKIQTVLIKWIATHAEYNKKIF